MAIIIDAFAAHKTEHEDSQSVPEELRMLGKRFWTRSAGKQRAQIAPGELMAEPAALQLLGRMRAAEEERESEGGGEEGGAEGGKLRRRKTEKKHASSAPPLLFRGRG